jgi:hypothetical protein
LRTDHAPSVALGTSPKDAIPKFLLVGGEGDDERKKFESRPQRLLNNHQALHALQSESSAIA